MLLCITCRNLEILGKIPIPTCHERYRLMIDNRDDIIAYYLKYCIFLITFPWPWKIRSRSNWTMVIINPLIISNYNPSRSSHSLLFCQFININAYIPTESSCSFVNFVKEVFCSPLIYVIVWTSWNIEMYKLSSKQDTFIRFFKFYLLQFIIAKIKMKLQSVDTIVSN